MKFFFFAYNVNIVFIHFYILILSFRSIISEKQPEIQNTISTMMIGYWTVLKNQNERKETKKTHPNQVWTSKLVLIPANFQICVMGNTVNNSLLLSASMWCTCSLLL